MREADALERARKLLAKAEAVGVTTEEAELLFDKAMELIAKYGIDEALLEAKQEVREKVENRTVLLHSPYSSQRASLWNAITTFNRVKAIQTTKWIDGKRVKVITLIGFPADIDICELLFTSLSLQVDQRLRNVTGYNVRRERITYFYGFIAAIKERLEAAEAAAKAEAAPASSSQALALRDRAVEVQAEAARLFPKTRTLRRSYYHTASYGRGHAHGMNANLHNRPAAGAGSQRGIGR